jgi:acyl dehydratase
MSVDPECVGRTSPAVRCAWSAVDAILYALAVGAGIEDLTLTTEGSISAPQRVIPTFLATRASVPGTLALLGDVDRRAVVHGSHRIALHRPTPPSGELRLRCTVDAIEDRGAGGNVIAWLTTTGRDDDDAVVVTSTKSLVIRGAGRHSGRNPPDHPLFTRDDPITTAPDSVVDVPTHSAQALLFRLCGDRNRLHSDPAVARRAGFPRPILHGMCTFGLATRAILATTSASPDDVASARVRFTAPVLPGETVTLSLWHLSRSIRFAASTATGVVLDGGRIDFA